MLPEKALRTVKVEHLHGRFSYEIDLGDSGSPDLAVAPDLLSVNENRLTLLYGKNGTGKTSLLRLLFHALSPAANPSHRNAISRTRFKRLTIELADGSRVTYYRPEQLLVGPVRAEVNAVDQDAVGWEWPSDGRPVDVSKSGNPVSTWEAEFVSRDLPEERFHEALSDLQIKPVFLGDSRAITSDALEEETRRGRMRVEEVLRPARQGALDVEEALSAWRVGDVEEALTRARIYLSQLVFAGTQAGSQRVDSVYLNVASAIVKHASTVGRPKKQILPSLEKRVTELSTRAKRFDAYGLLQKFPAEQLHETLADAPLKNGPLLQRVLEPYLDAFQERMDALEPGLNAISTFVDAINSFLEAKHVEFRPGRPGVRIIADDTGEPLEAGELSSGEKQIVLLFSDIVALQDETGLFIIDEPELSLNPDWQRKLMPALLSVTEQSEMQLLAATHSIEIMSRYRERIRQLGG